MKLRSDGGEVVVTLKQATEQAGAGLPQRFLLQRRRFVRGEGRDVQRDEGPLREAQPFLLSQIPQNSYAAFREEKHASNFSNRLHNSNFAESDVS